MPVYVVNAYDINDPEIPKTMNVIVEFPFQKAVDDFYNDPEYQAIIHLRQNSTSNCTMIVLKQYEQNK